MRALYFDGHRAAVVDRPSPLADQSYAVVRVIAAGVCNTDLELVKGYMGFRGVLGHELVGRVESGPPEWLGERVVGEINFGCGRCPQCARGLQRHCPQRSVMGILAADGAIAERVRVPIENLHRVPSAISDQQAVFTEPLAAAFEILEQIAVGHSARCAVLGDGKLGLLVAQVLAGSGAQVLCVGKHPDKLAILQRRGIATVTVDRWDRQLCDVVVEATGSALGLQLAIAATRPRGKLVLKSTVAGHTTVDLSPIVINEIEVIGSRCGPFAPALAALAADQIAVDELISTRVALPDAARALALAAAPGALKVLVDCG